MTTFASDYIGESIERITVLAAPQHLDLAAAVVEALQACGPGAARMHILQEDWPERLEAGVAICIGDGTGAQTANVNRVLERKRVPCLFVTQAEATTHIGPWTYYAHTACWECYQTTLRFFPHGPSHASGATRLHPTEVAAAVVAAVLEILAGRSVLIEGEILSIEGPAGARRQTATRILKDPLCSVCSIWSRQPTEAFYVQSV